MAKDTRSDTLGEPLVQFVASAQLEEFLFFFWRE